MGLTLIESMTGLDLTFVRFLLFALVVWVGVTLLLGFLSGWVSLAGEYRTSKPFSGDWWGLKSAYMGPLGPLGSMRNCLNIGANQAGLYLSVFFVFRPGHPPLFIPWDDITVEDEKGIFFRNMVFHFRRVPSVLLRVRESLGREIISQGKIIPRDAA